MRIELVGIDGAGKTTVSTWIAQTLGFTRRTTKAYDAAFRGVVGDIASLGDRAADVARAAAIAIALLREAATVPAGDVVFDRYVESARMFWSVRQATPLPADVLAELPENDVVVLLDVDPHDAIERRRGTSFSSRAAELDYLVACSEYLRSTAAAEGWLRIPSDRPAAETFDDVRAAIETRRGRRENSTLTD